MGSIVYSEIMEYFEYSNRLYSKNSFFDKVMYDVIERTYMEVIKNNYYKDKYELAPYKICYGEPLPSNFADNNALVVKVFFSKNTNEYNKENYVKNISDKKKYLFKFSERIKKEVFDKVGIKCDVIIKKVFD